MFKQQTIRREYRISHPKYLRSVKVAFLDCGKLYSLILVDSEQNTNLLPSSMDEGRKRVIGIMAAILASLHMQTADDLFGGPQGSPRSDKLIAASVQWAEAIMEKIDSRWPAK